MRKKIYLLLSLALPVLSFAQNPLVKQWDKRFGGTNYDRMTVFLQTNDGGFLLGGFSNSGISGDKSQDSKDGSYYYDYWIVKIDSIGNKQWDKVIGGSGTDMLTSMQQTTDGGYMLGGYSSSGISGDKTESQWGNSSDYWMVKIDATGKKQWDKRFGGTSGETLSSMQRTRDGGYILGGYSSSDSSGNKTQHKWGNTYAVDYWIVKVDSAGIKQWDKTFGGIEDDKLYSVQQTNDGGYILGGYSYSGKGGDKTDTLKSKASDADFWIIKVDSLGNKQWDKDFGGTLAEDWFANILQTRDGGYIFGGRSRSGANGDKSEPSKGDYDFWIIKTDSAGTRQWDKAFGGTGGEVFFSSIAHTLDGGFLLGGISHSYISGDKTESNLGGEQTWIVKTDSLGNKQWDKTLFTNKDELDGFAIQTKDSGYAFCNSSGAGIAGYKTQAAWSGTNDYWIIKFSDTSHLAFIPPACNFEASDVNLCSGDCIYFINQSSYYTSWQWSFPGAETESSVHQNPYICYPEPGDYDVKLVVANAIGKDSLTLINYIHVSGPADPVITVAGNKLYCVTDTSYASYQWYDNVAVIPGATDSVLVIIHDGKYKVEVTGKNGCKTSGVIIVVIAGETTWSNGKSFSIYPNPVTNTSILQLNKELKNAGMVIYDLVGKEVLRRGITGNTVEIQKGNLQAGIYLVKVFDDETQDVQKIVVE